MLVKRGLTGRYEVASIGGETVRAFVPDPLPPEPPLVATPTRRRLLEEATLALGRLDSITLLLPDPGLFLYSYVRREAVLSSQIEGTQSTLTQLMLFELEESPGVPLEDVEEVSNYVAALEHGVARLREGFPLCNRLIREMHAVLLSRGRGSDKEPGEWSAYFSPCAASASAPGFLSRPQTRRSSDWSGSALCARLRDGAETASTPTISMWPS